ncbi:hypothetical protein GDO81_011914 [Engystomops pustulosus]|uniref:Uncharacterized protein n=1 Tax=Engystomops pustulosus TaxID=76066 RepID=A0AAV7BI97_ENGPU|nr:hypothetical protein GDO81_011914 [Engystomops pustulosus]
MIVLTGVEGFYRGSGKKLLQLAVSHVSGLLECNGKGSRLLVRGLEEGYNIKLYYYYYNPCSHSTGSTVA